MGGLVGGHRERVSLFQNRINPQDKKDAMIIYEGPEISWLEKGLPDPTEVGLDVYGKLRKKNLMTTL